MSKPRPMRTGVDYPKSTKISPFTQTQRPSPMENLDLKTKAEIDYFFDSARNMTIQVLDIQAANIGAVLQLMPPEHRAQAFGTMVKSNAQIMTAFHGVLQEMRAGIMMGMS